MSAENKAAQALDACIALLHKRAPGSIGDMLHFQAGSCDEASRDYVLFAQTEPWMCNPYGTLHGGIISTIMDQAMGTLATCLTEGKALTPTVQLNVTFHHPLLSTQRTMVRLHVNAVTRTMLHLRAEASNEQEPQTLCASATGIFYVKHIQ